MNRLQVFAQPRAVHTSMRANKTLWTQPAVAVAPSAPAAGAEDNEDWWAILYEDADRKPELFTDEVSARKAFEARLLAWNCHLFHRVDLNAEIKKPIEETI
jgi:hypothetical protein